ncbi:hypothetical protein ONZ45_g7310 [Pleurotus djamor]|nr:hypothetical protein ONZ45_g7310 [Pleurotus djamor]
MEAGQSLSTFLQIQLSADEHAAANLPFILSTLSSETFRPSPHLVKWSNRVNSLMRSNVSSAQWAGLCLAIRTAQYSKQLLIESAQAWLPIATSLITKVDSLPTIKASIRLVHIIFIGGLDSPEFQRQLVTPNVSKFITTLIGLTEKTPNNELKVLCLATLTSLTTTYPSLSRPTHSAITTLSLKFLGGSHTPLDQALVKAASRLFSSLHHTGGKVASSNLWRAAIEETLTFAWSSFPAIRSSFNISDNSPPPNRANLNHQPPQEHVPQKLDSISCCITVLCDLLQSRPTRPVTVPVGSLTQLAIALLKCSRDEMPVEGADPSVTVHQRLALPTLWALACTLICALARSLQHHLTPHSTELVSYLTFHLEQEISAQERLPIIRALHAILKYTLPISSPFLPDRLAKVLLPHLTPILNDRDGAAELTDGTATKKGKKKAKEFEGDSALRSQRSLTYPSIVEGQVALQTLDALQLLLHNPDLGGTVHSISSRVLLSLLLKLPQVAPSVLSPDLAFHGVFYRKVEQTCTLLAVGTSSVMSRSVPMVIKSSLSSAGNVEDAEKLELLVHPRLPPLLRAQPHVEHLALSRKEESRDEANVRETLGLVHGTESVAIPIQTIAQTTTTTTTRERPALLFTENKAFTPQSNITFTNPSVPSISEFNTKSAPEPQPGHEVIKQVRDHAVPITTPTIPKMPPAPSVQVAAPPTFPTAQPMVVDDELPTIDMDSDSEPE